MNRLKADFHTHTSDDPIDPVPFSAEALLDETARRGFQVIAITCHERRVWSPVLAEYARRRGVLLVPGTEALIEGKHVVLLNPDEEQMKARTFAELRALGRRDAAVLAPHPFYPTSSSLWGGLTRNIDLFDAVEHCSLYFTGINPNRRAARVARKHGLPLLGTSDTHDFPYQDTTFTWVDVDEVTVAGVIRAVRAGRVELETEPRRSASAVPTAWKLARGALHHALNT